MKKTTKKEKSEIPSVPFDEAVKRLWKSPPQPKISKKKSKRKADK